MSAKGRLFALASCRKAETSVACGPLRKSRPSERQLRAQCRRDLAASMRQDLVQTGDISARDCHHHHFPIKSTSSRVGASASGPIVSPGSSLDHQPGARSTVAAERPGQGHTRTARLRGRSRDWPKGCGADPRRVCSRGRLFRQASRGCSPKILIASGIHWIVFFYPGMFYAKSAKWLAGRSPR